MSPTITRLKTNGKTQSRIRCATDLFWPNFYLMPISKERTRLQPKNNLAGN